MLGKPHFEYIYSAETGPIVEKLLGIQVENKMRLHIKKEEVEKR
jgi:hypothetical protein